MNDVVLELAALCSIIAGIILGYFFVFDYSSSDAFYLETDDENAYLEAIIVNNEYRDDNYSVLDLYGCRYFTAYSDAFINKSEQEEIYVKGEFIEKKFYIEHYE